MVYYHGTTKAWLPSILKDGLKPVAANAWMVKSTLTGIDLRKSEKIGWVYITSKKERAEQFAHAKVEYLRQKPGQESTLFYEVKDEGAPVIHTSPVVLKVDLPEGYSLTRDDRDSEAPSFKYHGSIPASCITVLEG